MAETPGEQNKLKIDNFPFLFLFSWLFIVVKLQLEDGSLLVFCIVLVIIRYSCRYRSDPGGIRTPVLVVATKVQASRFYPLVFQPIGKKVFSLSRFLRQLRLRLSMGSLYIYTCLRVKGCSRRVLHRYRMSILRIS